MFFNRISHQSEFVKVDPPDITTVICLAGGLFFSLGAMGGRYMDVALFSAVPDLLSLFYIF